MPTNLDKWNIGEWSKQNKRGVSNKVSGSLPTQEETEENRKWDILSYFMQGNNNARTSKEAKAEIGYLYFDYCLKQMMEDEEMVNYSHNRICIHPDLYNLLNTLINGDK